MRFRFLALAVLPAFLWATAPFSLVGADEPAEPKQDKREPILQSPTGKLPTSGFSHLDVTRIEDRDAGRMEALGQLGRVWVKTVPIEWGRVQKQAPAGGRPVYDWSEIDRSFLLWQLGGFEPVPVLSPRATWAGQPIDQTAWAKRLKRELSSDEAEVTLRSGIGVAPPRQTHWTGWERFVQAFLERYDLDGKEDMPGLRRPIRYVQVLDRVELPANWLGSANDYMRLLHHTRIAVERAAPKTQIIHAAIDLQVTGHLPLPPDDAAWKFRIGQQLPKNPPAARLEATRRFEFIQRTIGMPRLFDVMAHVGSHNLQDDVANLRFLRALLDRNEGKAKKIWLVDNPVTKVADSRVPRAKVPSQEEKRRRKRWLSAARFKTHGDHLAALSWVRRGQAFDVVRSYCRSRLAGADSVLFFPRADQVPEAPLRPRAHAGIPPALLRSIDDGTNVVHSPGPIWYAWRQLWKHTRDHRSVSSASVSAPGHVIVFEVPVKRRHAFVAVVLLDSHLSWAGAPGSPDKTRSVAVTLPKGKYLVEPCDTGVRTPARHEVTVDDGLLMLEVGPGPVYLIPQD